MLILTPNPLLLLVVRRCHLLAADSLHFTLCFCATRLILLLYAACHDEEAWVIVYFGRFASLRTDIHESH